MRKEILRIEDVSKSFGPTQANKDINLILERGILMGLAGENGSGKSTLASMICGMQKKDSGRFFKDGKEYDPHSPQDAAKHGIAMVVQELGVVGNLPGTVNMFLGKMDKYKKGPLVDITAMEKEAAAVFEKWNLPKVPLDVPAGHLSIEQRKIMELARALIADPDFLVLDEISQALSYDTRQILYRFIKDFKAQGRTILMVTHDLEEMMEICDQIAILRDGVIIASKPAEEFTMDDLKRQMIGREVSGDYYRDDQDEIYDPEVVLQVRGITVPGLVNNVSFDVHKGEILSICGLSDAGIHELGEAMFGVLPHSGTVTVIKGGAGSVLKKPGDLVTTNGAYLNKDRDANGLMVNAGVGPNILIPSLKELEGKFFYQSDTKQRALIEKAMVDFEIKCSGPAHVCRRLSGGNKQKVNLSRWLVKDLDYIILDCPTRGVDIGVKAYIYSVLKKAKAKGLAVVMISDELQEAMGMADRILVMKDHEMAGILSRNGDFTEDKMMGVML